MPDGIYLNAHTLGVDKVAKEINDLISNPQGYYDLFKWHRYYSFHTGDDHQYHDAVCKLCALLNKKTQRKVYINITEWWNSPYHSYI